MASALLAKPRRGGRPESDVRLDAPSAVGPGIAECLRVKGYCVINDAVSSDDMEQAIRALAADTVEFYQPAALVQEGLLGNEGSNAIARLESGEGAQNASLMKIDEKLLELTNAVGPYQGEIGFYCTTRSCCVFHKASEPAIEETDLVDSEANDWCSLFMTRKIIVILFLGPDRGTLELVPYDEDANPTDLATFPGQAVILRTDQMSFNFCTRGSKDNYIATCFMLQSDILGMHRNKAEQHMVPVARQLDSWIDSRLREIKENEKEEPNWEELAAVPRNFIAAANRIWFKKTQTAVRGLAARQPSCWEPEVMFLALTTGIDVVTDVPYCRWDHATVYDPDPMSWKQQPPKTSCRHASFCEGMELFDNKMFSISLAETKGMDPSQRQTLEVTYEALFRSGMKKQTLSNSSTAMYVGMSTSEWNYAEKGADFGIFGATGGAPSICAGRLSFCLGCKGASLAVDAEAASGLSSVFWAAESVEKKGTGAVHDLACGIGVHMLIAKAWWPAHSASGFLSTGGRCMTFDSSADGYVRNEAIGAAVVRSKEQKLVDGEPVKDDLPLVGVIVGGAIMNSGRSSGMNAPNGPTEQAVLHESCRKSGIMPYDVDFVECHCQGKSIADAVEVASNGKALRDGTQEEMLQLCSVKSNLGNAIEASGLVSLSKALYAVRWGINVGNVHLRQLNAHLDIGDWPLLLQDETLERRNQAVFAGVSSHGFGGTNVNLMIYGGVDEETRPAPEPLAEELRPRLSYWPAGGGHLPSESRPRKGFFVIGTWNSWEPEQMLSQGDGCHSLEISLGENRWEQFQILIDSSDEKLLYPSFYKAPKGTEVMGPARSDEVGRSGTWLIDARGSSETALTESAAGDTAEQVALSADMGQRGDRYKISLHVAGKWRAVTWTKVEATAEASSASAIVSARPGKYHVAGAWNDWDFDEMVADASTPGLHSLEVTLTRSAMHFQIVRNKDWSQTFFPVEAMAGSDAAIHGPDDRHDSLSWQIDGKLGDTFKIEFQRSFEGGSDVKRVSWRKVS
mmetsp:Transcript_40600/g.130623  ORF Transcript_40600/g.130623 Transcript_40600/m.130623 type:complete len:1023 (+) Transcript_40600:67-3135(+)